MTQAFDMKKSTASSESSESPKSLESRLADGSSQAPVTEFPSPHAEGVTPMLAQFLAVKAAHSDCLLFYRMGDFYEMFFGDAVEASAALDITLTKRGKVEGRDVPMCGVPVHAAESYLSRLIRKGMRVAICEQTESPADAKKQGNKGPLKRDVTRIVTPGTLVEDEFLPPRENNYLVAMGEAQGAMALAWVDLSTGDLFVETIEAGRLEESLARLSAAELIISDHKNTEEGAGAGGNSGHGLSDAETKGLVGCVRLRPARMFSSKEGEAALCRIYNTRAMEGIADLSRADYSAAGALVQYLDQTQKGRSIRLKPIVKVTSGMLMEIDPASRRSLEITRTLSGGFRGSLLSVMDETATPGGARELARRISAPLTDSAAINARLDLIEAIGGDAGLAEALASALREMPDTERALSRLSLGHGGPRDVAGLARGLRAGHLMASALKGRQSLIASEQFDAMIGCFDAPYHLAGKIDSALSDDPPLLVRDGGFIKKGYNAVLDSFKTNRDESLRRIAQLQVEYCTETGVGSLKIKHNNVLGYHIDVRTTHADKVMRFEHFIHRQTTAQTVRFTTAALADIEKDMTSAGERALVLELEIFEELRGDILAESTALMALAAASARLDIAVASASLAEKRQHVRPELTQDKVFHITKGRHPVVEYMLNKDGGQPFIANDCALGEEDRIWLLTGPNMAGKSTFLRQNALIAILAQAGLYVPAEKAVIGVVDRLFCRVGASDDLATGRSTFMVEMVETAAILNRSGGQALVILDEIGRGTATYDGLSLAWAVVEHLHEVNQCRALFASHYHELNGLSRSLKALTPHAMAVREWQGAIVFLHEVIKGGADKSYGIHVARLAGVPPSVLIRAEAVLTSLTEENAPLMSSKLDALPLFSAEAGAGASGASGVGGTHSPPHPALEHLKTLLPDTMTPKDALEALYALHDLLDDKDESR